MYANGNPLKFVDPSGDAFFLAVLVPVIIKAVAIGAAVGAASYTASIALSNGGFNNWSWGQFGKSVGLGALSGAVTFGIGSAFQGLGQGVGVALAKGLAHGVAQGGISELGGGSFMQGFASGALGSLGASAFGALAGDFANSAAGTIGFGALAGGVGAELTGGEFWKGALVGGMVAGLNHVMHRAANGGDKRNPKQDKKLSPGEIEKLKKAGWDHYDKGRRSGGQFDLYKDKQGNIYKKPKGNVGAGESIDWKIDNGVITAAAVGITVGAGIVYYGEKLLNILARRLVLPIVILPGLLPEHNQQRPMY